MIPNLIIKLLFLVFGTLRPGYLSYLQFTKEGINECTGWVKYWIVYAVLIGFWLLTDILFFWFPLYEELKLAFMVWLFLAPPSGSAALFDHIICPLLVRNEKTLEIALNVCKQKMYVEFRNVMRQIYAWMGLSILPSVINTIRVETKAQSESECKEPSTDEWEDALNTKVPEEGNDEVTYIENKPFLNDGASINQDANRNTDNSNNKISNNFMPTTDELDICQLIQLVQSNKGIKDVKDEANY